MVIDLSLVVALWIVGGEETMGDFVLGTEACYLPAHKIGSIVRDNCVRKPACQRNLTICCPVTSERGTAFTHLVK